MSLSTTAKPIYFRFAAFLFAACLAVTALPSSDAFAAKPKRAVAGQQPAPDRSAELVVDADTGRVVYARNAKEVRYPASLTKMMTLYLLFDALKHGEIRMEQELPVSAKAAAQPSTNLSLSAGDTITVRKAIEGLIVRSANDAAMVVAETLGKTEWNFALMMNHKARELGMRHTTFRNPSGLPNPQQRSTAMDLAKLGIALRRDFPEYYKFFSLREFDFNGRTYTTHNRVMARYSGADGLKTGYINSSGFNLVTSARKDGHRVVAVVMGGRTAAARDNTMIELLDRSFYRLAQDKSVKTHATIEADETSNVLQTTPATESSKAEAGAESQTLAALEPASGVEQEGEGDRGSVAASAAPLPTLMPAPVRSKETAKQVAANWGVQVGVFSTKAAATQAAQRARSKAGLSGKLPVAVAASKANDGRTLYRARVTGMNEAQARAACNKLGKCLAFKAM